ncbi:MAG: hypothetical protein DMF00_05230 [Verrucomicrobia bacterium]|nr:MAG: hypothetical protein DMF00_05230 [Verrucomicrobiota bacterium]
MLAAAVAAAIAVLAVAVAAGVAAGGLATGDAVGTCANRLIASAIEQMQRRINFFMMMFCSYDALRVQFGFNDFVPPRAIKGCVWRVAGHYYSLLKTRV